MSIQETYLSGIAAAIREVEGSEGSIVAKDFESRIKKIGVDHTAAIADLNSSHQSELAKYDTVQLGCDPSGLVTAVCGDTTGTLQLETQTEASITPTQETQVVVSAGKYTTGDISVAGDSNLVAENIAEGISIFGIEGTHFGGVDTSDATATADDIVDGESAYVNGEQVVGTLIAYKPITNGTSMPAESYWGWLVPGDTRMVAMDNTGPAATTLNGFEWGGLSATSGSSVCRGGTYGDGIYLAIVDVSEYQTGGTGDSAATVVTQRGSVLYSTNGIKWTSSFDSSDFTNANLLVFGAGKYILLRAQGFAYSADGRTWSDIESLPISAQRWMGAAWGNDRMIVVGSGADSFLCTTDGISWSIIAPPDSKLFCDICYGDGKFVAVTTSGESYTSEDGTSWAGGETSDVWAGTCKITYGDGVFVCCPMSGSTAYYSVDGLLWESAELPHDVDWGDLAYAFGKFFLVAYNSAVVVYSYDGVNWSDNYHDLVDHNGESYTDLGDATPSDVARGKIFSSSYGVKIVGTATTQIEEDTSTEVTEVTEVITTAAFSTSTPYTLSFSVSQNIASISSVSFYCFNAITNSGVTTTCHFHGVYPSYVDGTSGTAAQSFVDSLSATSVGIATVTPSFSGKDVTITLTSNAGRGITTMAYVSHYVRITYIPE